MATKIHQAVERALCGLWDLQEAAAELAADKTLKRQHGRCGCSVCTASDVRAILRRYRRKVAEIEGSAKLHILHAEVADLRARWAAGRNITPCVVVSALPPQGGA